MSRVQVRPNSFAQSNQVRAQLARVARSTATPMLKDVNTTGLTSAEIDGAVTGSSTITDLPDGLQITDKSNGLLLIRINGIWKAIGALGVANYKGVGNTLGTGGAVAVISALAITLKNPAGSQVRISGAVSGYTATAGSVTQLYYQVDGGSWLDAANQVSNMFWNVASQHLALPTFEAVIGPLTSGEHTIAINASCSAGSWNRDTNDWASLTLIELP